MPIKEEDIKLYKFHPKVLKAYQDADFFHNYVPNATEENEKDFWLVANQSKQPIKKEITKIIRVKKGGKEYFYYHEEVLSTDHVRNEIHYFHTVGKYDMPYFNNAYDPKTGRPKATQIVRREEVFELEWPKDWTPELEDLLIDDVDLLVVTKGRKYGGFSFEDFKEKSFDDLVTLGKYGTLAPKIVEVEKRRAK